MFGGWCLLGRMRRLNWDTYSGCWREAFADRNGLRVHVFSLAAFEPGERGEGTVGIDDAALLAEAIKGIEIGGPVAVALLAAPEAIKDQWVSHRAIMEISPSRVKASRPRYSSQNFIASGGPGPG